MTKTDPLIVTSQHPQLSRSVESLTATHDGWTYTREIQARGAAQVAAEDLDHWRTMFRPQDGVHPDRDSAFQHARDAHLFVHAITVDDLVAFYQRRGWAPLTDAELAARASRYLGVDVTVETVDALDLAARSPAFPTNNTDPSGTETET